jgi:methyl-accepting chemotaxis protein
LSNLRKNYFIKKGFQTRLTLIILLIVIIVANLVGGIVYGILSGSALTEQFSKMFNIHQSSDILLPTIILAEVISFVVVAMIGLFVSHTMAGPIYRFERVLEDLSLGNLDSKFKLRTTDEFHEIELSLNDMITTFHDTVAEAKKCAIGALENLQPADSSAPKIQEAAKLIVNLKTALDFFTVAGEADTVRQKEEKAGTAGSNITSGQA